VKIGKLFFLSLFFSDFCEPKLVGEDLLGREHGVGEEGLPESLLRAFWEKVPELKEIETLGGSIKKIETLVAELKIAANFRG
jgi:hypothetical protein